MRTLVSTLLVGLILICPLLCRAAEMECCLEPSGTTGTPQDDSHLPPSCPNDGIDCICAGATQTGEFRAGDMAPPDLLPSLDAWAFALLTSTHVPVIDEPSLEGAPAGLAVFGNGLAVRAYLQDFRF